MKSVSVLVLVSSPRERRRYFCEVCGVDHLGVVVLLLVSIQILYPCECEYWESSLLWGA